MIRDLTLLYMLHVQMADEAVLIGAPPAAQSYLVMNSRTCTHEEAREYLKKRLTP